MKIQLLVAFFLVVLVCGGCNPNQTAVSATKVDSRPAGVTTPEEAAARFVQAMQLIAQESKNSIAEKFGDMIEANALYVPQADPEGKGRAVLKVLRSNENAEVPITVVVPTDAAFSPEWESMLSDKFVAQYIDTPPSIVLPMSYLDGVSPVYVGLVGQHEMVHFTHAPTGGKAPTTFEGRMREEYEAYTYEFELLHKVGGKAYERALNKEVERIAPFNKEEGEFLAPLEAPYAEYAHNLDTVFRSKPINNTEGRMRMNMLLIDAIFTYHDRTGGDQAEVRKINFLKTQYQQ